MSDRSSELRWFAERPSPNQPGMINVSGFHTREEAEAQVLAWQAERPRDVGIHYWERPSPYADLLASLSALSARWRELAAPHLKASGDEAEWAACRMQCADDLDALIAAASSGKEQ